MNWVLDLIVIAIIAICVFVSSRRGFVKVLIETVGFIAAIILAFTISTPLANATYDKIIEPPIITAVSQSGADNAEEIVDNTIEALPDFISDKVEVYSEKLNDYIAENMQNGVEQAVKTATQTVLKPTITKVIGFLYSLVLIIVLLVVVKLVAKIVNGLFTFSIVGKLNRILGGLVGLVKGVVLAFIFCMIINFIVSLTDGGFLIFTSENIYNTSIFKLLISLNTFDVLNIGVN